MAMGRRKAERQERWVATTDLPCSPGHAFYDRLNELLAAAGFDRWIEAKCAPYYDGKLGRPAIPPGVYFRMVLVGHFEGISSQRGIAWRCRDSRSLAEFLGYGVDEATPDHSSMTRTHQRLPLEIHQEMFRWVLKVAVENGLIDGKTVAVDSTTLEASAAMKSIVRKDSGESWNEHLARLAKEAGIENPTADDLRRFDKSRKEKKVSNEDWESPTDTDARIARMKDGTTHLAYKAENVVDVNSDLIVGASIHSANAADTQTLVDNVLAAQANLQAAGVETEIKEIVADKGYHSAKTLEHATAMKFRTYIPEPKRHRGPRKSNRSVTTGKKKPKRRRRRAKPPLASQHPAVRANRRRVRGKRSKRLQRLRSERVERSFAHVCETGGARRCWLRGKQKVEQRYLLQVAARNLSVIMRRLFGVGTPRSLQGLAALSRLAQLLTHWWTAATTLFWESARLLLVLAGIGRR